MMTKLLCDQVSKYVRNAATENGFVGIEDTSQRTATSTSSELFFFMVVASQIVCLDWIFGYGMWPYLAAQKNR
jgi:hypothetical protein